MSDIAAFIRARLDEKEGSVNRLGPRGLWLGSVDKPRVLRDIAAKRAIVELHDGPHECSAYDHNGDIDNCTWIDDGRICSTLRLIAAIDSDHPDYDETWKPLPDD